MPEEIADQIIDRTDGVPLFIEELTKSVVESGLVTKAGDHYSVAGPIAPLAIPTTLHDGGIGVARGGLQSSGARIQSPPRRPQLDTAWRRHVHGAWRFHADLRI